MVLDRAGNLILNHRKKHLYETDKSWAQEGAAFSLLEITTLSNHSLRFALGICMDLNPWEFKDMSQFELAAFCKEHDADGLLFISAWTVRALPITGQRA